MLIGLLSPGNLIMASHRGWPPSLSGKVIRRDDAHLRSRAFLSLGPISISVMKSGSPIDRVPPDASDARP